MSTHSKLRELAATAVDDLLENIGSDSVDDDAVTEEEDCDGESIAMVSLL